jgi:hypothetical protein
MIVEGGKELLDNKAGGSRNDLECDEVLSLFVREKVHISCGSSRASVFGVQSFADREASLVDSALIGVPIGVADDFLDTWVITVTLEIGPRDDPDKWLLDIVHFLSHGIPPNELPKAQRKWLGVRSQAFTLMSGSLYHKSTDGVWRHVVRKEEQENVLRECHSGVARGHYAREIMARKVWQSGLSWPMVLRDAHLFVKECDLWQRTGQPQELTRIHQPVLPLQPFQKWGLDFVPIQACNSPNG